MANALGNVNIQYNYHTHEGTTTSGTGCYTTPNIVNVTCTGWIADEFDINGGIHIGTCNRCGRTDYTTGGKICGRLLGTRQDGYKLDCGKTEDTIESATIIY